MHDIRFIRENPAAFDAGLARRGLAPLSTEILALDDVDGALVGGASLKAEDFWAIAQACG